MSSLETSIIVAQIAVLVAPAHRRGLQPCLLRLDLCLLLLQEEALGWGQGGGHWSTEHVGQVPAVSAQLLALPHMWASMTIDLTHPPHVPLGQPHECAAGAQWRIQRCWGALTSIATAAVSPTNMLDEHAAFKAAHMRSAEQQLAILTFPISCREQGGLPKLLDFFCPGAPNNCKTKGSCSASTAPGEACNGLEQAARPVHQHTVLSQAVPSHASCELTPDLLRWPVLKRFCFSLCR